MPAAAIVFLIIEFVAIVMVALAITAWARRAPERLRRTWWALAAIVVAFAAFGVFGFIVENDKSVLPIVAVLLALLALGWCAWALFIRDRSRGRRRCPKCWYDMSGTNGLRCPECGRTAKREKSLHRTRRHWRLAMLAILPALMAAFLAVQPKVQRDGWVSMVPTTALIWCMDFENNEWAFVELGRRALEQQDPAMQFFLPRDDALYEWQWCAIGRNCMELLEADQPAAKRYGYIYWLQMAGYHLQDDPIAAEIDATFVRLLDDADPNIRSDAALLVSDPQQPEISIERLRPLVHDQDARTRRAAVIALRRLVDVSEAAVELASEALVDEDADVRSTALWVIRTATEFWTVPDDIVARVRAMGDDPDPRVRESQMRVVFKLADEAEFRPLVESALHDDDPARRRVAFEQIGGEDGLNALEYLDELLAALDDPDSYVRMLAAGRLRYDIELAALAPHEERLAAALDPEARPESADDLQSILVEFHHLRAQREMDALENESVTE